MPSAEERLAGVEGFEPSADGFGDRCSTRLSYTPARRLILRGRRTLRNEAHVTETESPSLRKGLTGGRTAHGLEGPAMPFYRQGSQTQSYRGPRSATFLASRIGRREVTLRTMACQPDFTRVSRIRIPLPRRRDNCPLPRRPLVATLSSRPDSGARPPAGLRPGHEGEMLQNVTKCYSEKSWHPAAHS